MKNFKKEILSVSRIVVIVWVVISLGIIALMTRDLWWNRDFQIYRGKSIPEQRRILLERSGQNKDIMDSLERIARSLPSDAKYTLSYSGNERTYIEYYLIPRAPVADGDYVIKLEAGKIVCRPSQPENIISNDIDQSKGPAGWLLSIILVSALSVYISRKISGLKLSFPEAAGLSIFLMYILGNVSKLITGSVFVGFIIFSFAGIVCFLISFWQLRGKKFEQIRVQPILILLLISLAVSFLLSLAMSVVVVPDDWDAWATWAAKAKSFLMGNSITDVTVYSHKDYPLMWPSIWAYSAWLSGGWEEQWSRGWSSILFLLTCWQTGAMIFRVTQNRLMSFFGASLFAVTPKIIVISSWSYAEPAVWFFAVCCVGRLMYSRTTGSLIDIFLAGLFAGIAALVKNEGILFAISGLILLMTISSTKSFKHLCLYICPLVILCLPWMIWTRLVMGYHSEALSGLIFNKERIVIATGRIWLALRHVFRIWMDVRQWSATLFIVLAGVIWILIRRSDLREKLPLIMPLLLLMGHFIIILFHACDMVWIINTSWDRTTAQILAVTIPVVCICGYGKQTMCWKTA